MGILENIDNAAWDLEHGHIDGLYPVSNNLTIVPDYDENIGETNYSVFSYTTLVARVILDDDDDREPCTVLVERDAFHHSFTTSRHLRRFLSAMVGRVDFNALYEACDRERVDGNRVRFINVREVA